MPTMPDKEKLKTIDPDRVDAAGTFITSWIFVDMILIAGTTIAINSLQNHLALMNQYGFSEVSIGPDAEWIYQVIYSFLADPLTKNQIEHTYLPFFYAVISVLITSQLLSAGAVYLDGRRRSEMKKSLADSTKE